MKKLLLTVALLALAAGIANAYTQVSPAPAGQARQGTVVTPTADNAGNEVPDNTMNGNMNVRRRTPTRPVPEPGTMALASMGLLALGAAARKRRARD